MNEVCPTSIHQEHCYKRFPYSIGNCPADFNRCYLDQSGNGDACPYNLCRSAVVSYCDSYLMYVAVGLGCCLVLSAITNAASVVIVNSGDSRSSLPFQVLRDSEKTDLSETFPAQGSHSQSTAMMPFNA